MGIYHNISQKNHHQSNLALIEKMILFLLYFPTFDSKKLQMNNHNLLYQINNL